MDAAKMRGTPTSTTTTADVAISPQHHPAAAAAAYKFHADDENDLLCLPEKLHQIQVRYTLIFTTLTLYASMLAIFSE